MKRVDSVTVQIPPGDLLDKISILEIKSERMSDEGKLANVRAELGVLAAVRDRCIGPDADLGRLAAELKALNEALWIAEDEIRECERRGDFGSDFVAVARRIYQTNDRRAAVKRAINERLGSRLVEEKSYTDY